MVPTLKDFSLDFFTKLILNNPEALNKLKVPLTLKLQIAIHCSDALKKFSSEVKHYKGRKQNTLFTKVLSPEYASIPSKFKKLTRFNSRAASSIQSETKVLKQLEEMAKELAALL